MDNVENYHQNVTLFASRYLRFVLLHEIILEKLVVKHSKNNDSEHKRAQHKQPRRNAEQRRHNIDTEPEHCVSDFSPRVNREDERAYAQLVGHPATENSQYSDGVVDHHLSE